MPSLTRTISHLPVLSTMSVGAWHVSIFLEQRHPLLPPAEDVFVEPVFGRLRLAVVDPAINQLLPGRYELAASAWSVVRSFLRTVPDPVQALNMASAHLGQDHDWLSGPILSLAVVDLDPGAPLMLAAVRAGDAAAFVASESFCASKDLCPLLSGPCITAHAQARLDHALRSSSQPEHVAWWSCQVRELTVEDFTCTPLGVLCPPRLESWDALPLSRVHLATDGALTDDYQVLTSDALLDQCPSPHPDRAFVSAKFVPSL